jgi:hypothetical protein
MWPCKRTRTDAEIRHPMPLPTLPPKRIPRKFQFWCRQEQPSHIKPLHNQGRSQFVASSQLTRHIPQNIFLQPQGPRSIQQQRRSHHGAFSSPNKQEGPWQKGEFHNHRYPTIYIEERTASKLDLKLLTVLSKKWVAKFSGLCLFALGLHSNSRRVQC